jgi:hypothetical protein
VSEVSYLEFFSDEHHVGDQVTSSKGVPLLRLPLRVAKRAYVEAIVWQLKSINRDSGAAIVRPGGPVVSLTSYGKRIDTAYLAIESIARGSLLPSELILWLDEEMRCQALPATLQRLKQRGLSVRLCKNYGPHKKYYPYVDSNKEFFVPLTTADDDVLYPKDWLETLATSFKRDSNLVHGYRARVISFDGNHIAPYHRWTLCSSIEPSWKHLLNGVSGVIYPPALLAALKNAGSEFEQCCPKADDIWLHANALRAGFRVRQIGRRAIHFPIIPGSQETALYFDNTTNGNDTQIAKTYTPQDMQRMAEG